MQMVGVSVASGGTLKSILSVLFCTIFCWEGHSVGDLASKEVSTLMLGAYRDTPETEELQQAWIELRNLLVLEPERKSPAPGLAVKKLKELAVCDLVDSSDREWVHLLGHMHHMPLVYRARTKIDSLREMIKERENQMDSMRYEQIMEALGILQSHMDPLGDLSKSIDGVIARIEESAQKDSIVSVLFKEVSLILRQRAEVQSLLQTPAAAKLLTFLVSEYNGLVQKQLMQALKVARVVGWGTVHVLQPFYDELAYVNALGKHVDLSWPIHREVIGGRPLSWENVAQALETFADECEEPYHPALLAMLLNLKGALLDAIKAGVLSRCEDERIFIRMVKAVQACPLLQHYWLIEDEIWGSFMEGLLSEPLIGLRNELCQGELQTSPPLWAASVLVPVNTGISKAVGQYVDMARTVSEIGSNAVENVYNAGVRALKPAFPRLKYAFRGLDRVSVWVDPQLGVESMCVLTKMVHLAGCLSMSTKYPLFHRIKPVCVAEILQHLQNLSLENVELTSLSENSAHKLLDEIEIVMRQNLEGFCCLARQFSDFREFCVRLKNLDKSLPDRHSEEEHQRIWDETVLNMQRGQ